MQLPAHACVPPGQLQTPLLQASAGAQVLPQVPQLAMSPMGSTHSPLHSKRPPAQVHAPRLQVSSGAHALWHVPQCAGSDASSTQAPPHSVSFGPQGSTLPVLPVVAAPPKPVSVPLTELSPTVPPLTAPPLVAPPPAPPAPELVALALLP